MRFLLGGAVVVMLLAGCAPSYGHQICKTASDCGSGLVCPPPCPLADGGVDPEARSICGKTCTQDSDCTDLGLAKPVCGTNTCGGPNTCLDNPF